MDYKFTSRSEDDTRELAENIESEKFPGMVICLIGELGSGKTAFVKGFAASLGLKDDITSPTFNIVKEYEDGEMPLFHMDVYRLEDTYETIGFNDYFKSNGVTIIEWADMIEANLPKDRLDIYIKVTGEDSRTFILKPHGKAYEDICEAIL
jgi:tRNA threonylcarbamoyladenosine biosynthesis protein TsaE